MAKAGTIEVGMLLTGQQKMVRQLQETNRHLLIMNNQQMKNHSLMMRGRSQTSKAAKTQSAFASQLKRTAVAAIGFNFALMYISQVFQKTIQYVNESVQRFRDFENQMREVGTILGDVAYKDLPQFTEEIEYLSVAFGKSTKDLSRGLYDILSAAVDSSDAIELLATASKAAIAGLSSVEKSVDIMTSVLNSYGFTVEQMTHVSDVMFQSVIRGKFTFDALANALGYVAPIAAQAGVSFEELSAAIATATRHGLHIDMTARGLALAIQNIIKPSKQAADMAAQLGIDLSMVTLQSKGLIGFLEELNRVTEGNAAIISQLIPNMRSYRIMMVLAGKGIEGFKDDMVLMSESLGQTEKAFAKMADTFEMKMNIIKQAQMELSREMGEMMAGPALMWERWMMALQSVIFERNIAAGRWRQTRVVATQARYEEQFMKQMEAETFDREETKPLFQEMMGMDRAGRQEFTMGTPGESPYGSYIQDARNYGYAVEAAQEAYDKWADAVDRDIDPGDIQRLQTLYMQAKWAVEDLADGNAYFISALHDAEQYINSHSDAIDNLILRLSQLGEEVGEVGVLYDGTLGKQLKIAQAELAIDDATYELTDAFRAANPVLAGHVEALKANERAQKDLQEATDRLTLAQNKNNLEMMKIQLRGMQRRRGLNRMEKKRLKTYQIDNMKLRIEGMEQEIAVDEHGYSSQVQAAKDFLARLKDTRAEDINNLIKTIAGKENAIIGYTADILRMSGEMETALDIYKTLAHDFYAGELPADIQLSINALDRLLAKQKEAGMQQVTSSAARAVGTFANMAINATANLMPERFRGSYRDRMMNRLGVSYQRGTHFVPQTGMYQLHRGEQIDPPRSGRTGGGGASFKNATINMNVVIENRAGVTDLAKQLAIATKQELTREDNSKYRLR